jgi:hypothetical protein
MIPARRVGPGQALWARGVDASTPAAFCSALLTNIRYVLPEDVPPATWKAALRHFAERQMPEATLWGGKTSVVLGGSFVHVV